MLSVVGYVWRAERALALAREPPSLRRPSHGQALRIRCAHRTTLQPSPPLARPQVVRNLAADDVFVLYHCGLGRPADSDLPSDVDASTAKFFATPLHKVSVPDTTALGFMVSERLVWVHGARP